MSKENEIMEVSSPSMVAYRDLSSVRLNADDNSTKESINDGILLIPDGKPLKRFLWWHMTKKQRILVIVGLALLLLFIVILIAWFAVVPAIIRHYASSVQMKLNYMDVVEIPDNKTLSVDVNVNIQHNVGIGATTKKTTVSLLYDGFEFATLPFPGLEIHTGSQNYNITINGDMPLTNLTAFNTMSKALVNEAEITMTSTALLTARAWGMEFDEIHFKRDLPIQGFTGFSDPEPVIENIELTSCSSSEYLININVTLNNTARMGLDGIGALNMSLYYGQQYLGYALSQKPELGIPRGVSDQSYLITVDANAVSITSMLISALAGSTQFYIVGNNPYVTNHGQFVEALSNVNMSVPSSSGSLSNLNFGESCSIISLLS